MDWEFAFKFFWLFMQLCVVCMAGAFIADHIVQPILNRWRGYAHGETLEQTAADVRNGKGMQP